MSIYEKCKKSEDFSETENQILQYLFQNDSELEKMTIKELAANTYSSNATIIRMCHKLGFSGFRDFKIAFVKETENHKLITNKIDYSFPFQIEESTAAIAQNMYSLFKECMDMVHSRLDLQILDQMAKTIEDSQRTFLFGVGDTQLTIRSFINKGAKINFFPILASENNEQYYICKHINLNDCAMFITYGGRHASFDYCVKMLRRKGVKVMVLTGNPNCFIARHSSYCITIPDMEKEAKIATFYSQMVFQYILNLLFSLLYRDYSLKLK